MDKKTGMFVSFCLRYSDEVFESSIQPSDLCIFRQGWRTGDRCTHALGKGSRLRSLSFYTDKLKEAIQKNLLAPGHPLLQLPQRPSTTSPSLSTSVAHQTDPPRASVLVHLSKVRPPYLKGKTHGSFWEPTVLHAAEETMGTKCKN